MEKEPRYSAELIQRLEEQRNLNSLAKNALEGKKQAIDSAIVQLDPEHGLVVVDYMKSLTRAVEQTCNTQWILSMVRVGVPEAFILATWNIKDDEVRGDVDDHGENNK